MGIRECSFLATICNSRIIEISEDKFWISRNFYGFQTCTFIAVAML
jgi:hypothetical protein